MPATQTTIEALYEEFEGLLHWHARKQSGYGNNMQGTYLLDYEDYLQAGRLGLLEDIHELDGLEDDERVQVVSRIIRRHMDRQRAEVSWTKSGKAQVVRSGQRELVPIIELTEDGATILDILGDGSDDFGLTDWMLMFEAELPERTVEMIRMRLDGYTWGDIGEHYGITDVSAWQAVMRGLARVGFGSPQAILDNEPGEVATKTTDNKTREYKTSKRTTTNAAVSAA